MGREALGGPSCGRDKSQLIAVIIYKDQIKMKNFVVKNGVLVRDSGFKKLPYGAYKTRDVAFTFRMGAGFAGTVNTSHPAAIRGFLKDPTNPPTFFGQAVAINPSSNAVRSYIASDSTTPTDVFGVIVRPYPFQGATAPTANYAGTGTTWGGGQLPDGAVDVLLSGFIMVPVVGTPSNGSTAYIWDAASQPSPYHIQSGWEAATPSSNGFAITNQKTSFASPPDANGIAELRFNV